MKLVTVCAAEIQEQVTAFLNGLAEKMTAGQAVVSMMDLKNVQRARSRTSGIV